MSKRNFARELPSTQTMIEHLDSFQAWAMTRSATCTKNSCAYSALGGCTPLAANRLRLLNRSPVAPCYSPPTTLVERGHTNDNVVHAGCPLHHHVTPRPRVEKKANTTVARAPCPAGEPGLFAANRCARGAPVPTPCGPHCPVPVPMPVPTPQAPRWLAPPCRRPAPLTVPCSYLRACARARALVLIDSPAMRTGTRA